MIISACLLALSCSKAMPDEAVVVPAGEKVTFTIPETKVTIGADEGDGTRKYAFEEGDVVYAVTTGGSVAAMEFKGENTFTGEFSKPVGTDEKISLYYNCYSAENNAPAYVQNGKPWLVSSDNGYSRDDNNTIILSATLDAPKGVIGLPVISRRFECTIDFHAKNKNISIASFDGTSFSGGNAVTGISLKAASGDEYAAIVNVPAGMEGGFWIKAVKGQQSMYKSTSATVGRKSFIMNEFTPVNVSIDVQISGFPTSYSYYVGEDDLAKSIETANNTANDWMGKGSASYTITRSGIPAALLSFKSFKLTVDGKEYTGNEATRLISVEAGNGHTTWGQKDIVATVIYKDLDGNTYTGTKTITRHITGLPYNKDKNPVSNFKEDWNTSGGKHDWQDSYLRYGRNCVVTFKGFNIPSGVTVGTTVFYKIITYTSSRINDNTTTLTGGTSQIFNETVKGTAVTKTFESSADVNFKSSSNNISTTSNASTSSWAVSHSQLHYIGVIYR
mgnify:FL=1